MIIGVLALQGSVVEHVGMLRKCNVEFRLVKNEIDLEGVDGLILPGGESTTIKKILKRDGLWQLLKVLIKNGLPVWGTCAGMILLAELGVVDYEIKRNAYGAQFNSEILNIDIRKIVNNFPAVFIRAPKFAKISKDWEVLAEYEDKPIFIIKDNIWASSFHPELTNNPIIHQAFVNFCKS